MTIDVQKILTVSEINKREAETFEVKLLITPFSMELTALFGRSYTQSNSFVYNFWMSSLLVKVMYLNKKERFMGLSLLYSFEN